MTDRVAGLNVDARKRVAKLDVQPAFPGSTTALVFFYDDAGEAFFVAELHRDDARKLGALLLTVATAD